VVVLQEIDASRPEDVEELALDEADEAVEARVVLAQEVRQRLQQIGADAVDRLADGVVRERVPDQRQLDAEDLALDEVLDLLEDRVEAADDDRRVGEKREQAR